VSAFHLITKLSSTINEEMGVMLDVVPFLPKFMLSQSTKVKSLSLTLLANLVLVFPNALTLVLETTSILFKIFAMIGSDNKKVCLNVLETLNTLIS